MFMPSFSEIFDFEKNGLTKKHQSSLIVRYVNSEKSKQRPPGSM